MRLTRTFFVGFLAFATLAVAGGAEAKEPPTAVEICGPAGCATVAAVSDWNLPAWLSGQSTRSAPAAPAAFYTLGLQVSTGTTSPIAFYVPSARLIKLKGSIAGLGESMWFPVEADTERLLEHAIGSLRPFARPSVGWAMVGSRWVKRPSSYAKVYALQGPSVADPAAPAPALQYEISDREAWFATWGPYLERVRREWIRVQIGTRKPSPWDSRESFVWLGRRLDILKRDGQVIQIPSFVARLIRSGAPL